MTRESVVDFHTHAFPDRVAEKAMGVLQSTYEVEAHADATLAGLRASMAAAGIAHCAVMTIATSPAQMRSIAEWAAANSGDDFTIFGSVHPAADDPAGEVTRMGDMGIRGIKLHAEFQGFRPDEERMFPIYEALRAAGMIVFFHAGNEIKPLAEVRATPGRIARVLDALPGLTVIAAHMGAYLEWDEVWEFLVGREIYFDTSFCLHKLGTQRFVDIVRAHGAQRILFGTDSPWGDQTGTLTSIRALPLRDDERRMIFRDNAQRLLNLGGL